MLLDFGLQELFQREVLDVVDDAQADQLRLVVDPNQERVVNLLVAAQETRVVVDGDLHQAVHRVLHTDGS